MKKKNYIFIVIVVGISALIILLKNLFGGDTNISDIKLYNTIIQESISIDNKNDCNEIEGKELREICIRSVELKFDPINFARDFSDCDKMNEMNRNVCYYNVIMNSDTDINDQKMCEKISDISFQKICKDSIVLKYDDMSMIETFEGCSSLKASVTETKEKRQDVCRYNQMKKIATQKNYQEYCDKLVTIDMRKICMDTYSLEFN